MGKARKINRGRYDEDTEFSEREKQKRDRRQARRSKIKSQTDHMYEVC